MEVTVLLSLVVFMMFVNEMLPPTADSLPAIGMIVVTTMIEVVMALVMAVAVTFLAHKNLEPQHIPTWLAWLLGQYGNERIVRRYRKAMKMKEKSATVASVTHVSTIEQLNDPPPNRRSVSSNLLAKTQALSNLEKTEEISDDDDDPEGEEVMVPGANHAFSSGVDKMTAKNRKYWMEIARILDRFFLVVFGITTGSVNLFLYLIMLADDTYFDVFTSNIHGLDE